MAKKPILVSLLVLTLSFSTLAIVEAQTNSSYEIALQGPTWDHSAITILVIPQYNEPWWNPSYLNSSLRAIDQWNEAIAQFASNFTDYAYLSRLRIEPQVSNTSRTGFDSYLSWIDQFGNVTCEAGLTRTTYTSLNIITNTTLTFSAYDCRGNVLSEVDMQNVALHELGHCIGLGHANVTGDTMYYAYSLNSPTRALSTLDVYGIATVFRWMAYSQQYNPDNQGSPTYSVTLPSTINYEYLPIPEKDLPSQTAIDQIITFFNGFTQFILQPEILVLIILAVAAVAAYATIAHSRMRRKFPRQP